MLFQNTTYSSSQPVEIPQQTVGKYLGLHLDVKMTWKHHTKQKRKQLDLRLKKINLSLIHI